MSNWGPMKNYIVHLGIFDDGDVAPTEAFMTIETNSEPRVTEFELDQIRGHAEALYGRAAPDHALFWSCTRGPDS